MKPDERAIMIEAALMRTFGYTREEARAMLALHLADKLHEIDEDMRKDRDDNPYRIPLFRRMWREGGLRVQQFVFMAELRLRAKAQYYTRDAFTRRTART